MTKTILVGLNMVTIFEAKNVPFFPKPMDSTFKLVPAQGVDRRHDARRTGAVGRGPEGVRT